MTTSSYIYNIVFVSSVLYFTDLLSVWSGCQNSTARAAVFCCPLWGTVWGRVPCRGRRGTAALLPWDCQSYKENSHAWKLCKQSFQPRKTMMTHAETMKIMPCRNTQCYVASVGTPATSAFHRRQAWKRPSRSLTALWEANLPLGWFADQLTNWRN